MYFSNVTIFYLTFKINFVKIVIVDKEDILIIGLITENGNNEMSVDFYSNLKSISIKKIIENGTDKYFIQAKYTDEYINSKMLIKTHSLERARKAFTKILVSLNKEKVIYIKYEEVKE